MKAKVPKLNAEYRKTVGAHKRALGADTINMPFKGDPHVAGAILRSTKEFCLYAANLARAKKWVPQDLSGWDAFTVDGSVILKGDKPGQRVTVPLNNLGWRPGPVIEENEEDFSVLHPGYALALAA